MTIRPLFYYIYFHKDWKIFNKIICKIKKRENFTFIKELNSEEGDVFIFDLDGMNTVYNFTTRKVCILDTKVPSIPKHINNKISKLLDNYLFNNYKYN